MKSIEHNLKQSVEQLNQVLQEQGDLYRSIRNLSSLSQMESIATQTKLHRLDSITLDADVLWKEPFSSMHQIDKHTDAWVDIVGQRVGLPMISMKAASLTIDTVDVPTLYEDKYEVGTLEGLQKNEPWHMHVEHDSNQPVRLVVKGVLQNSANHIKLVFASPGSQASLSINGKQIETPRPQQYSLDWFFPSTTGDVVITLSKPPVHDTEGNTETTFSFLQLLATQEEYQSNATYVSKPIAVNSDISSIDIKPSMFLPLDSSIHYSVRMYDEGDTELKWNQVYANQEIPTPWYRPNQRGLNPSTVESFGDPFLGVQSYSLDELSPSTIPNSVSLWAGEHQWIIRRLNMEIINFRDWLTASYERALTSSDPEEGELDYDYTIDDEKQEVTVFNHASVLLQLHFDVIPDTAYSTDESRFVKGNHFPLHPKTFQSSPHQFVSFKDVELQQLIDIEANRWITYSGYVYTEEAESVVIDINEIQNIECAVFVNGKHRTIDNNELNLSLESGENYVEFLFRNMLSTTVSVSILFPSTLQYYALNRPMHRVHPMTLKTKYGKYAYDVFAIEQNQVIVQTNPNESYARYRIDYAEEHSGGNHFIQLRAELTKGNATLPPSIYSIEIDGS